jgi:hypothetical protein
MTDEILKLNENNELIAEDPSTGDTRPIKVADLSASGDVSATNVTADTQMNSSSTRPNIFADTVDANQLSGVSTGSDRQGCRVFLSSQQTVSSSARIQFDAKVYDSGNNFDTSTHKWTCPKDGLYFAHVQVDFEQGNTRTVSISDGTGQFPSGEGALTSSVARRDRAVTMNKYQQGDKIAGRCKPSSSDTLKTGDGNFRSFMEVAFLGSL